MKLQFFEYVPKWKRWLITFRVSHNGKDYDLSFKSYSEDKPDAWELFEARKAAELAYIRLDYDGYDYFI